MADVFISYSSKDSEIAKKIFWTLKMSGVKPFLAEMSLIPGKNWKEDVLENLRQAKWVFFLATKNSCNSQAVNHEIGATLVLRKNLVPIIWQIKPYELPDWIRDRQAVDLDDTEKINGIIKGIAEKIKANQLLTGLIIAGLVGLTIWELNKD